jgi:hypothetical protein
VFCVCSLVSGVREWLPKGYFTLLHKPRSMSGDGCNFRGQSDFLLSSEPSMSEGQRGLCILSVYERSRERREIQSKWVRRDITWRDHSTEATMDELTLVIGEYYSDVVERNVAS